MANIDILRSQGFYQGLLGIEVDILSITFKQPPEIYTRRQVGLIGNAE